MWYHNIIIGFIQFTLLDLFMSVKNVNIYTVLHSMRVPSFNLFHIGEPQLFFVRSNVKNGFYVGGSLGTCEYRIGIVFFLLFIKVSLDHHLKVRILIFALISDPGPHAVA